MLSPYMLVSLARFGALGPRQLGSLADLWKLGVLGMAEHASEDLYIS